MNAGLLSLSENVGLLVRDRVAKTQDETYASERTKPFPLTELDFSG